MDICPLEMFSRYLLLYRVSYTTCPLLINKRNYMLWKTFKWGTFLIYGVCKKLVPASIGTTYVSTGQMVETGPWSKEMGLETSLPFERCLASTPKPISIVFCQNLRCSMVICTLNPDFEIKSSYCGDYRTVK